MLPPTSDREYWDHVFAMADELRDEVPSPMCSYDRVMELRRKCDEKRRQYGLSPLDYEPIDRDSYEQKYAAHEAQRTAIRQKIRKRHEGFFNARFRK